MGVIGFDFGNTKIYTSMILGMDEQTRMGGVEMDLVPARFRGGGIPSTYHISKKGTSSYGEAAENGRPSRNRRSLLKRRMSEKETIDGHEVCYREAVTELIGHAARLANDVLEENGQARTDSICLTYPVTFRVDEIELLRELAEAATLADGSRLKVVGMLPEPVAAALCYLGSLPVQGKRDHCVMVYDMGGGTFDATIVTAHRNEKGVLESYRVESTDGARRAGNEFTQALKHYLLESLRELGMPEPQNDQEDAEFTRAVEEMKLQLDHEEYWDHCDEDGDPIVTVSRSQLIECTREQVDETIAIVRRLYDGCAVKPELVLMTGGQSRMPILKERLVQCFPELSADGIVLYKNQTAISYGAARFAGIRERVTQCTGYDIVLTSVEDPETHRVRAFTLIPHDTPLPMEKRGRGSFTNKTPTIRHTIELAQARTAQPDPYRPGDYETIGELVIDFGTATPTCMDFELEVWMTATDSISARVFSETNAFEERAAVFVPRYR